MLNTIGPWNSCSRPLSRPSTSVVRPLRSICQVVYLAVLKLPVTPLLDPGVVATILDAPSLGLVSKCVLDIAPVVDAMPYCQYTTTSHACNVPGIETYYEVVFASFPLSSSSKKFVIWTGPRRICQYY